MTVAVLAANRPELQSELPPRCCGPEFVAITAARAYGSDWSPCLSDQRPPDGAPGQAQTTALAQRRDVQTWADPDWQRFWLTVDRLPWRSLAFIAAGDGAPPDFPLSLVVTLSRTGVTHLGGPVLVADGTQVPLNELNAFLNEVRTCIESGQRVLLALSPVADNPTASAIAKAADAVVLCVLLGRMRSASAEKTVKAIGSSKFVGSVIIRPTDPSHGL
jgi:hypothetical protein